MAQATSCKRLQTALPMAYKVFLVEDEIVTREGIRDNVNWQSAGFAFCGEAPDGELALPLIQSLHPDLLITDIKMPFMDGLQLSRLVREQSPDVRIVILSGHDEFQYAREAISIGVSDYLLKPLGVRELESLLRRIATQLDQEQRQQSERLRIEAQLEDDLVLRRERLLLRLLTVGASAADAIEESRALALDLSAHCYQTLLLRVDHPGASTPATFADLDKLFAAVVGVTGRHSQMGARWLGLRKDVDEIVLILLGDDPAACDVAVTAVVESIRRLEMPSAALRLYAGTGSQQQRLHELNLSFSAALVDLHTGLRNELSNALGSALEQGQPDASFEALTPRIVNGAALLNLNRAALSDFLQSGGENDFDAMFDRYMGALDIAALRMPLVHTYIRTDITLTVAKFINRMGGQGDYLFAELSAALHDGSGCVDLDELRAQARDYCLAALDRRDTRALSRNSALIDKAQRYIEACLADPALSLSKVANEVGLSPNHFSAVFSSETGETFRDFLTRLRIARAKMLLRSEAMTNGEICEQVGYSDPHYFGAVFKRVLGVSPQQFRQGGESGTRERIAGTP